jgi:hypothetical protein
MSLNKLGRTKCAINKINEVTKPGKKIIRNVTTMD